MKQLEFMTEAELHEFCTGCAAALELVADMQGVERPYFALVLFNDPKVGQYISNCTRETMIQALRETAERLEKNQDVGRTELKGG
jgi:enoyl-CoA hydratase/carnithine racemase